MPEVILDIDPHDDHAVYVDFTVQTGNVKDDGEPVICNITSSWCLDCMTLIKYTIEEAT